MQLIHKNYHSRPTPLVALTLSAQFPMAELSRGELLAWVNDLTNLNLAKVELMGTGAAHCLIIHSIYGDVPTHKINFKAIHEYEYVHNFKVLQEAFTRHRIDRVLIPRAVLFLF